MFADENELLRAERRGRALAMGLKPANGHAWRIAAPADADGAALLAAARWARRFGADVEVAVDGAGEPPDYWRVQAEYLRRGGFLREAKREDGDHPLLVFAEGLEMRVRNIPSDREAWARPLADSWRMAGPITGDSPRMDTASCRAVDGLAIHRFGVSGLCLMENAALAAVAVAMDMLPMHSGGKALVAAGGGNNGGDGLAVARGLNILGVDCEVALMKPPESLSGDAGTNLRLLREHPVRIHDIHDRPEKLADLALGTDLVVDALLGTGFKGVLSAPFRLAIDSINLSGKTVLALDLPSGLDGDTGVAADLAVRADRTVTFAAVKYGLEREKGSEHAGELYIGDIGAPSEALAAGGDGNC